MNSFQITISLLTEPSKAWDELRKRPTFWFPLLVVTLGTAIVTITYFYVVDMTWFNDLMVASDPRLQKVAPDRLPTSSRNLMLWSSLAAIVGGTPIMRLAEGTYYFLAGKITNVTATYKHWFALACWSSMPLVLSLVVAVVALLFHLNGQVSQEQLNLLSLNELWLGFPPGHRWHTLATTLTLLHPWAWWLAAVGVKAWSGRSWLYSSLFSLIPWIAMYGVWALVVAL